MTDEYPSWREALRDNSKFVNIRCIAKFFVWHFTYILLTIGGGIMFVGVAIIDALALGAMNGTQRVDEAIGSDRVRTATSYLATVLMVGYVAAVAAWMLYLLALALMNNPMLTLGAIVGTVVALAAILLAWAYGGPYVKALFTTAGRGVSRSWSKTVEVSKGTPGVRRVVGECPVHMSIEPKWFEKLFGDD